METTKPARNAAYEVSGPSSSAWTKAKATPVMEVRWTVRHSHRLKRFSACQYRELPGNSAVTSPTTQGSSTRYRALGPQEPAARWRRGVGNVAPGLGCFGRAPWR